MFNLISLSRVSHNIVDERVNYILWEGDPANLTCINLLKTVTFLVRNRRMRTKNWPQKVQYPYCGCGQNLTTNALKRLMDQLEERIL